MMVPPIRRAVFGDLKLGWHSLLGLRRGTVMVELSTNKDPVVITKMPRKLHLWEEPPARGAPPGGTVCVLP